MALRRWLLRWSLVIVAIGDFAVVLFDFLSPGHWRDGLLGAAVFLGSTLLIVVSVMDCALRSESAIVRNLLTILIVLDIICAGFAALLMQAFAVLGTLALAFLVWAASFFKEENSRDFDAAGKLV